MVSVDEQGFIDLLVWINGIRRRVFVYNLSRPKVSLFLIGQSKRMTVKILV